MLLFKIEEISEKVKRKRKNIIISSSIIELYKDDFISHCLKLKKQGCNSVSKNWWRFRFYEFLKCDEQSKTNEIWEEKTRKYQTWDLFWSKHWKEIIDERLHHLGIMGADGGDENDLDSDFDY